MKRSRLPMIVRFARYVQLTPTCWRWVGKTGRDGYGYLGTTGGRFQGAHRVSYRLFAGDIPQGFDIDHLCRNRWCVNPEHLEPVTRRTNLLRGVGFPAQKSRQSHCIHGHIFDAHNTKIRRNGTRLCLRCYEIRKARNRKGVA